MIISFFFFPHPEITAASISIARTAVSIFFIAVHGILSADRVYTRFSEFNLDTLYHKNERLSTLDCAKYVHIT